MASRYGRPPRSGVAVEARKTVMAFRSGWLRLVGCIGPGALLRPTGAWGQGCGECSPRTHRQRSPILLRSPLRPGLPPELLLNRLAHEVLQGGLMCHAVQLEAAVKVFGDARRQLGDGFVGLCHARLMPPSSSIPVDDRDHRGVICRAPYDLCVNHWRQLACG